MTELRAKRLARIRDGGKCVMCYRGGVWHLHGHHIYPKALYPALGAQVANLVTLCLSCHLGIVHSGRITDGGQQDGNWVRWVTWCRDQVAAQQPAPKVPALVPVALGVPTHFRPSNANRSACGVEVPQYAAFDGRGVDCLRCRKTTAWRHYMDFSAEAAMDGRK